MKKITVALVASLVISGCSTQTFTLREGASAKPTKQIMQPFFVSGIGQTQEVNPATVCGGIDKVAKVEVQQSFLDGLLGGLTWGIFTPREARVYCSQ